MYLSKRKPVKEQLDALQDLVNLSRQSFPEI
jgi:hypothetical protein